MLNQNLNKKRAYKKFVKILLILLLIAFIYIYVNNEITEYKEYSDNEESYNLSEKGYELMEKEEYEDAIEYFLKAIDKMQGYKEFIDNPNKKYTQSISLTDIPLNNLSWAYIEIGEYEKSLIYIEQALRISPNDDVEYINRANALFNLGRYEESIEDYTIAIDMNHENSSRLHERANAYYQLGEYEKALKDIDEYIYIYPDDTQAYISKGEILKKCREYDEIKKYYDSVLVKFNDNVDIKYELGIFYYDFQEYEKSLSYFLDLIKNEESQEAYIWCAKNYDSLGQLNESIDYMNKAINLEENSNVLTTLGEIYLNNNMYEEGIETYYRAFEIDKSDEDTIFNILNILYSHKRYEKCIEFANGIKDIINYEINLYKGDAYYELGNYKEAIKEYERALEISTIEEVYIYENILYCYMCLQEYEDANEIATRLEEIDNENYALIDFKDKLKQDKKPLEQQITEFMNENYLYTDIKGNLNNQEWRSELDNKEIRSIVELVRKKEDMYTFALVGDEYKMLNEEAINDIEFKDEPQNSCYVKINNFSLNTDDKFIEYIDGISDGESKNLIIDLRGNSGGDTEAANNILEVLLPECVTSTLIYKDGYTYNYYSEACFKRFKKIYVFVDEYSASASELVTLGLKTYLDNVTIIGRNTVGKGVGQYVFDDIEKGIAIFAVNHFWNVREKNIMNIGIKPDIYVQGKELNSFMQFIE